MYRFSLAFRYLRRRKVAYVSVLAIAVGIMAMIVVNSVMDGFQRRIKESIFKIDGSLKVRIHKKSPSRTPGYFETIQASLEPFGPKGSGEILGMSRRIVHPGMLVAKVQKPHFPSDTGQRQEFISLIGIDSEMEKEVLPFNDLLDAVDDTRVRGESRYDAKGYYRWNRRLPGDEMTRAEPFIYEPKGGLVSPHPGIILGSHLAEWLAVEIGDPVHLVTVDESQLSLNPEKISPITKQFIVTGCFESGRYEYDRQIAFCDVNYLQQEVLGWAGNCSEVRIRVADPEDANELKAKILASTKNNPDKLVVQTWEDQMRTLAQALEFERLAMWLVTAFVVIVAGVSIGGLLYMVVLEKTRDIGILQSMGASSGGIVVTFLIYGGMLGVLGTLLGVWLGIVVVKNLNGLIHWLEDVLNRPLFPPDIYEFGSLPSHLNEEIILSYAVFTFGWCLLVSIIPAFVAARLDPLRCLSYE